MRSSVQIDAMTFPEYKRYCMTVGFPWCDTCENPVVWHDGFGYLHSSSEHHTGILRDQDTSDHTPTCRAWWNDVFE